MATTKKRLTPQDINNVLEQIDGYLVNLQHQWDQESSTLGKNWWTLHRKRLGVGFDFIIKAIDKLVLFVEDAIPTGTDKKAAVMMVVGKLFDYILVPALPIWLRPFASAIKEVIVTIIIGSMVEFIVSKYNQGIWKKDVNNAQTETKLRSTR